MALNIFRLSQKMSYNPWSILRTNKDGTKCLQFHRPQMGEEFGEVIIDMNFLALVKIRAIVLRSLRSYGINV